MFRELRGAKDEGAGVRSDPLRWYQTCRSVFEPRDGVRRLPPRLPGRLRRRFVTGTFLFRFRIDEPGSGEKLMVV